jgi:lysozyme
MSKNGLSLLKAWEGCVLHQYKDPAGLPSIGIGHLLTRAELASGKIVINGLPVKYTAGITTQQALDLLAQDLIPAERAVNTGVKVGLTQNQFDALTSFAFNAGDGAFAGSTLLRLLNQGQYSQVPAQLMRWVHAGGEVCDVLKDRRAAEVKLWNGGV